MKGTPPLPTRLQLLHLYRSLLRVSHKFTDYNIREYTKRRTIDGFHSNKSLTDPSSISTAFHDAMSQLDVAKRQSIVYSLYAPKIKSIMDVDTN